MVEERERKPKYNPADYAQIQVEAKAMDKTTLEEYYVKDRDKRHTTCAGTIGAIIGIILLIGFFIFAVSSITKDIIYYEISYNIEEISEDVCPMLGSGYTSDNFFKRDYNTNKIVCNNVNSILE